MAKKVKLLCDPTMIFSIGEETIKATDLTLEQAQLIADQYPGQYVDVVNDKAVDSGPKTTN